ncbi:MAG TPA: DEAD/DEAH box helicase [Kofleriaceae bacterium]|nr:DEAD/DEAH box helicase [Kofleriaceae bacterium]
MRIAPVLTPHGRLVLAPSDAAPVIDDEVGARLERAFARGAGHGLVRLGGAELHAQLPAVFSYWRRFAAAFINKACASEEIEPPELGSIAAAAPPMTGAEYVSEPILRALWDELALAFAAERREHGGTLAEFLHALDPAWNLVGRVYFNLAEHRADEDAPFAFLATYTHAVSAHGRAQHLPLGEALREYASARDKPRLLSLLEPVQRAARSCAWLRELIDEEEIFHPLRWSPDEAFRMLGDVATLEAAGVRVRMPQAWRAGRPARPEVRATVGAKPPSGIGADALLDFEVGVTLDGERLTASEIRALLRGGDGLAMFRGKWIEVDREKLGAMLAQMEAAQRAAADRGLSIAEAMRLIAGASIDPATERDADWSRVVAGPWLAETLAALRAPSSEADPGAAIQGTLRPYQRAGVQWLRLLSQLGLGACLADDMGLGKTIQVLALLSSTTRRSPSVLVAPASLLANWASELARFAPSLRAAIAHPSAMDADTLATFDPADHDLVITSYGSLLRLPWLASTRWDLVILDEAQAIKNPGAKQTRAAKQLTGRARIALTGTPIENRLGDLWSIFDFLNPGLLGTAKEFTAYTKRVTSYAPLRELVRPYVLRRMKTDRAVIADLPDKSEVKAYCALTRRQAALYQQAVDDLAARLASSSGIARKGAVLASITRLKQICNHPSHWLGDGEWSERDSGKWARLRELAEVIAAKQEKVLVFSQFREMAAPLAAFLAEIFGRPGLVLTGSTAIGARKQLVARFQDDRDAPFFVLSLKAGGTGLNLTAASHVIHVDRWWNPAVEDQATDRAFRIGQHRNVLVHKFVCRGTVEEKIDAMIEAKRGLARELLTGGAELNVTELSDAELLKLVALDLGAVDA